MKRSQVFASLLACLFLLSCGAQGATVMGGEELELLPVTHERPTLAGGVSGEDAIADMDVAVTDEPARLASADALHTTAGDHAGWTAVSATMNLSSAQYYLSGDFTGNLTVAAGETADLCLNGHTITSATGTTITVGQGATLRICDCQGGGCVTGARVAGSGVKVEDKATLELYGGRISGNQGARALGGGVRVMPTGTFRMSGGSIDANTAIRGGGVYVSAGGKFVMTGGSITGNNATTLGGGVCILKDDGATSCKLSGSPVITNNTVGSDASNVYLSDGGYISVPAALSADAQVGVSVEVPGVFAVPRANMPGGSCGDRFTSDDAAYGIGVNAEGRLLLNVPVSVTYTVPAGVTGTAPATQYCIAGETVTLDTQTVLTKDGYGFAGWTNNRDVKKVLAEVVPTEDTTLYPIFYVGFEDAGKSTDIHMTYGEDAASIDLSDFVRTTDGNSNVTFRFLAVDTLPTGLKLVNDTGGESGLRHILTGIPVATPGDYTVKFTVSQVGEAAVLFDLAQSPSFRSGELELTLHIAKPAITAENFDFSAPADLTQDGQVKAATVTPKRSVASGIGEITLSYSPADPVAAGTYRVYASVAEGTRYQKATNLTDPLWTFTIEPPAVGSVTLGPLLGANGQTRIDLTPTPANLLNGAQVLAAQYENGAMVDLAWGTLSGTTVTFPGKQLSANDGWKLFFLSGDRYAPLCPAVPLSSPTP